MLEELLDGAGEANVGVAGGVQFRYAFFMVAERHVCFLVF